MQIQTYLLKKGREMDSIGETFEINTWDFDWYIGENKIGVINNPSTEGGSFMKGFLVRKGGITIVPSKKHPSIERDGILYGRMRGESAGIAETYDLIELIKGQEVTHAFLSFNSEYNKMLSFSPVAPSDAYKKNIILPVSIDTKTLKENEEIEKLLEGINNKRNNFFD